MTLTERPFWSLRLKAGILSPFFTAAVTTRGLPGGGAGGARGELGGQHDRWCGVGGKLCTLITNEMYQFGAVAGTREARERVVVIWWSRRGKKNPCMGRNIFALSMRASQTYTGRSLTYGMPSASRRDTRSKTIRQLALKNALDAALEATVVADAPMRILNVSSGLAVDLLSGMGVADVLSVVADHDAAASGVHTPLGNEAAARTWVGDVASVPPYMGPFSMTIVDQGQGRA